MDKHVKRCCADVYDINGWHSHKCDRKASIERNGKFYCKTHDPVAINEKKAKKYEEFNKKLDESIEKKNRQSILEEMAKDIPTNELSNYILIRRIHEYPK